MDLAIAQESSQPIEPVVVTAARDQQSLADVMPSVTVLTRADIERSQSRDLVELLGRQTGIEFARSGGEGAQTSLFLRGANSNQVLVLIDGVRVNTALDGAPNLGGISTDEIERIEIVRGNLSSLYGSEAIGGVIQIFTRGGTKPGAQAFAEAGQGHTRDAGASVTTPVAGALLSISAGMRQQAAVSAIDTQQVTFANPLVDANHARNGSVRWDQHAADWDLNAWAWGRHNDTAWDDPYDSSATIPSTLSTEVEHRTQDGFGLSGSYALGSSRVRASVAQTQDDSSNVSNVPLSYDDDEFVSRNRQLSLQDTTTFAPGIDALFGWELLDQLGSSTSYDPAFLNRLTAFDRHVDSFWAGTNGRAGAQQWQANLRHDQYTDMGGATTGLLAYGYWFDPAWKATAQYSTAFRAPSFNELYYPVYGNPALRPERARNEEIGVRWAQGASNAGASIFRNRTNDLIEGLAPSFQEINIDRASLDGAELQGQTILQRLALAGATLDQLDLGASLSLDRPRDLDTGLPLLRRSRTTVRISASLVQGPWTASTDLQRTGPRDDIDYVTLARTQLPAYNLARFTLARAFGSHVRIHVRVENLFNAHYQLADGFNTLPRMIIGGVEVRM
jgi:vitamin B12 transporter